MRCLVKCINRTPVSKKEGGQRKIKAFIDVNCHITTREITGKLYLSVLTLHDHLQRVGLITKLYLRISCVLTERKKKKNSTYSH